jgi:replication initiation protein RepC
MSSDLPRKIGAVLGNYVDERASFNMPSLKLNQDNLKTAARPSKTDLLRLYNRAAQLLGHSQSDQRFHIELIRLTKPADYTDGRQVILAHSNGFLQQRCSMSRTALGRQLRRHDGSTVCRTLSGNGHRYVARRPAEGGDGEIIDGCGISLEPLIAQMMSMVPMMEAQDELALALRIEKARIGRDRRRQRAAFEKVAESDRAAAMAIEQQSKALAGKIKSALSGGRLSELQGLADIIARAAEDIEKMVPSSDLASEYADAQNAGEIEPQNSLTGVQLRTPQGSESGHQLPLQSPQYNETVVLGEKDEKAEPSATDAGEPDNAEKDQTGATVNPQKPPVTQWNPRTIVECFPGLAMYVEHPATWRAIDAGASRMARDMGVNARSWHQAGLDMGLEQRCVAIGLVAELLTSGRITSSAGQYFGGMLKRAQQGELHLDRSVWGLRRQQMRSTSGKSY